MKLPTPNSPSSSLKAYISEKFVGLRLDIQTWMDCFFKKLSFNFKVMYSLGLEKVEFSIRTVL